ncbi:MAG: riboflavin synthase, partial [Chitinophagaceae bacterium]
GIIENTGKLIAIQQNGTNTRFTIESSISKELKVDQSVSHSGFCLTVEKQVGNTHTVTAIAETLAKTNLADWQPGQLINLERCMQMNGRLDGHIVQGHVDAVAVCTEALERDGSWEYRFQIDKQFAHLVIEKGSVCLNGISLTCFAVADDSFKVAIIPYTYHHTNIHLVQVGTRVNIEFDVIGKYIHRLQGLQWQKQ